MILNTTYLGNHSNIVSRLYPRRLMWGLAGTQPTLRLNEHEIFSEPVFFQGPADSRGLSPNTGGPGRA